MNQNLCDDHDISEEKRIANIKGPVINPDEVDFSQAVLASVRTLRFVLPVPALPGGGELAFEPDTKLPILNKEGVQKRGFVFRNFKDEA